MRTRTLAGVQVSALGLGTSTWGTRTSEADAAVQLRLYRDQGGNFLDTADIYGDAELVVGAVTQGIRDELFIATKAGGVIKDGKPGANNRKEHLTKALDRSLTRLRTDHVDLWQLHAHDPDTPLDDTLEAVADAVKQGKTRFAGLCNHNGQQTTDAATSGLFTSVQVEYSLLERRIERDLIGAAQTHGLAVLPWAPLGRGVLTGKYLNGVPEKRGRFFEWYVRPFLDDRSTRIVARVTEVAADLGVSAVTVALAWARDRPGVVAPLVGARTADQLQESLAQPDFELPDDARHSLDQASAA